MSSDRNKLGLERMASEAGDDRYYRQGFPGQEELVAFQPRKSGVERFLEQLETERG